MGHWIERFTIIIYVYNKMYQVCCIVSEYEYSTQIKLNYYFFSCSGTLLEDCPKFLALNMEN